MTRGGPGKKNALDQIDIPDRPRSVVMGVILHQVDNQNHIVTAVVVDKYGEVQGHWNFSKLMEPRSVAMKKRQQSMAS
jgi:hypothetical protein